MEVSALKKLSVTNLECWSKLIHSQGGTLNKLD